MSATPTTQRLCQNCRERPAIVEINGVELCVNCNAIVQRSERDRIEAMLGVQDELGRMMNFLGAQMESVTGVTGVVPRIETRRPPVVQTGPVTHNIEIHDNAIGVLNTGTIHHLDATIGKIRGAGAEELADALKAFVETVANNDEIEDDVKETVIESVDFILEEVGQPEGARRTGLLRSTLKQLGSVASTVVVVGEAWQRLEPLLRGVLHLIP